MTFKLHSNQSCVIALKVEQVQVNYNYLCKFFAITITITIRLYKNLHKYNYKYNYNYILITSQLLLKFSHFDYKRRITGVQLYEDLVFCKLNEDSIL